jgi:hypothetical protein
MVEMVTMLAVASKLLAALVIRIGSATGAEMPGLAAEANASVEGIVRCRADTTPLERLTPEDAATIRADLISLGDALRDKITWLAMPIAAYGPGRPRPLSDAPAIGSPTQRHASIQGVTKSPKRHDLVAAGDWLAARDHVAARRRQRVQPEQPRHRCRPWVL